MLKKRKTGRDRKGTTHEWQLNGNLNFKEIIIIEKKKNISTYCFVQ